MIMFPRNHGPRDAGPGSDPESLTPYAVYMMTDYAPLMK